MLRSHADFETERVLPFERSVDEDEPAHAGEGWKSKRYTKSNVLDKGVVNNVRLPEGK